MDIPRSSALSTQNQDESSTAEENHDTLEQNVQEQLSEKESRTRAKTVSIIATVCLTFILVGLVSNGKLLFLSFHVRSDYIIPLSSLENYRTKHEYEKDSNILATAVPAMTREFGSIADIGWYAAVYRLAAGSFQFPFGKIYSMFPTKPILLADLAVFAAGSLLCALAPTPTAFILGRAIVGLATAGAVAGAFAIIVHSTPLRKRPTVAGIGGATEAVASIGAPLIGGLLIDHLSWRWCYYIELPLIALTFFIVLFAYRSPRHRKGTSDQMKTNIRQLDLLGAALFIPCLTTLILALQWGGIKYPWHDWRVLLNLAFFVILLIAFAWLQRHRKDQAMLPTRILVRRSVLAGLCFSLCNNAALSIVEYYMPIYFQVVRKSSVFMSGVIILPISIGLVISVFLAGFLTSSFGYYNPFMIATGILTPLAAGLMTTLEIKTAVWMLVLYQGLLGFGAGIGFQGPQVAVQTIFPDDDSQIALAIIQFAQSIGPAIFVAVAQNIFASRLLSNIQHNAFDLDVTSLIDQGLTIPEISSQDMMAIISGYALALTQTFYLAVGLSSLTLVSALVMEWRSVERVILGILFIWLSQTTHFAVNNPNANLKDILKCATGNFHDDLSFLDTAKPIRADEFFGRRDRLAQALVASKAEALVASKADAFVLEPGFSFQYYANTSQTDWEPWEPEERPFLMLILPQVSQSGDVTAKTAFLAPHFEEGRVRMLGIPSQEDELDIIIWEEHWDPYATLLESRLFVGFNDTTTRRAPRLIVDEEIRDFISRGLANAGFETVGLTPEVELIRQIKSPAEVEILRAVNTGTVAAVRATRPCLVPGLTENEVQDILNQVLLSVGFDLFFNIVLFEEDGALPHGGFVVGSKKLTEDTMIVIDVGAHYLGYASDICRSFFIDPVQSSNASRVTRWLRLLGLLPLPERVRDISNPGLREEKLKVWDVVLAAQSAAAAALKPNNTAASVDVAARSVIQDAGYGERFTHRLGHGIGIKAHESPYLNKWNREVRLQPGMIFTDEPGIYIEGKFGVRHEDVYLVKENGQAELLTGQRAASPYNP
ncbi:hypothetical protein O1611_g5035 [Lasiodiplodia mahajangana]|uniref:Uncharacterized protein n=1 Tax=Lasiodiplodia mahajangana TaxID=1108764 RepID=A0ACC2JM63_9PEZI|nr:hypothetical protein O1611_g5035 [Lasiodiplodia mahajangana]